MVKVRGPATTANMGPGFDVLGMALNIYNYVEMWEISDGLEIIVDGEGKGSIDRGKNNIAYLIARRVFDRVGHEPSGLGIRLVNEIPTARGLGSSAAALVGAALAANVVSGGQLTEEEILGMVSEMEGHPDNAVPALVGGVTICIEDDGGLVYRKMAPPSELQAVIAIPRYELSTEKARSVLPKRVSFGDAIFNMGRVGLLVHALERGDLDLLGLAMKDRLHQPHRMPLIPGMGDVFSAALEAGAVGAALSGAGPTLIAFTAGDGDMPNIKAAMEEKFKDHEISCIIKDVRPDLQGAVVLDENGGK